MLQLVDRACLENSYVTQKVAAHGKLASIEEMNPLYLETDLAFSTKLKSFEDACTIYE